MLYGSIHPKGDLPVDPNDIHYRELNITGTFSHDKESFREAVALLNERLVDVSAFISDRVSFPNVDYAMQRALAKDTYRVVVEFCSVRAWAVKRDKRTDNVINVTT